MCTVSIVPVDGAVRVVCNRDERRARSEALSPTSHVAGRCVATFPVDPESGGTWIGVNDAGVAMALLNRTLVASAVAPAPGMRSRGAIIPSLMHHGSGAAALAVAASLDAGTFAPFRLLILQGRMLGIVSSDGRRSSSAMCDVDRPLLFTSSSLGDALVEAPRSLLFARFMDTRASRRLRAQDRFHQHRWPQWPAGSVLMERADARTVSRTVVALGGGMALLRYEPVAASCDPEAFVSGAA
jgi:hypothetical protein